MKRVAAIITVFLVFMTLWVPAFAADKLEAVTVRLEKTEGSGVSVKTNAEKKIKISEGMRLFNGYKVSTNKDSYAYLSLDESKAVKLGTSTKVELKKEGNKNQVLLSAGELFFNVSKKLKSNEVMEIKTSNISMGIRGTSGTVLNSYSRNTQGEIQESRTVVQLYDGETSLSISDPSSAKPIQYTLTADKAVEVVENFQTKGGEAVFKALEIKEIPSFAADEILKSPELIKRIEESSTISKEEIVKALPETVKLETEVVSVKEQAMNTAKESVSKEREVITPSGNDSLPSGNTGGSGGGNGNTTVTPQPVSLLTGSGIEVKAVFDSGKDVQIPAEGCVEIGNEGLIIPIGRKLTNAGEINCDDSGTLVVVGELENKGNITGTMNLKGIEEEPLVIVNSGSIEEINLKYHKGLTLKSSGTEAFIGKLEKDLSVLSSSVTFAGSSATTMGISNFYDENGDTLTNILPGKTFSWNIALEKWIPEELDSAVQITGEEGAKIKEIFEAGKNVIIPSGHTLEIGEGELHIPKGRTLINEGTISINSGAEMNVEGTFLNVNGGSLKSEWIHEKTLSNRGKIVNLPGASIEIIGMLACYKGSEIINKGEMDIEFIGADEVEPGKFIIENSGRINGILNITHIATDILTIKNSGAIEELNLYISEVTLENSGNPTIDSVTSYSGLEGNDLTVQSIIKFKGKAAVTIIESKFYDRDGQKIDNIQPGSNFQWVVERQRWEQIEL